MTYLRGVQADGSWHVYAGDANKIQWQFLAGGVPWNLTGVTITSQARKRDVDTEVALVATIEIVNAITGTVNISWDGDDVRTLLGTASQWDGVYDIQLLSSGQTFPESVHRARMRATMDVTRS